MSSIDERVVSMKFNNSQFQAGVKQTTQSLDDLKKGLNLDGATKGLQNLDAAGKKFSLAGMAQGIDTIVSKFSALSIAGITALVNLTNKAVDAGIQFVKSFTFEPIMDGLREFETNMGSIQTVLANTASKGTTLDQVNAALQELNTYSDKTIYNFTEMARNIGTFTAAGVDLNTSVAAIKGIANLAAVSGSTSEQASTAMYQLSQAIASGTVKLQDWNSVVNAGMGGEQFQEALKRTARVHGVAVDELIKKNGSFRESLQEGWLTAQILTETLSTYTGDLSAEQLRQMGYTDQQIQEILKMGKIAQDAATKVKTASQLLDTLKEAVGSGWTQTWQILIGNFQEAQDLFTGVSDVLSGMVGASADARNTLLQGWKDLGGRQAAIDAVSNAFKALMAIVKPIKEALKEIFPTPTAQQLVNITNGIRDFTKSLIIGDTTAKNLKRTFAGVFAVFDIVFQIIGKAVGMFAKLFGVATKGSGTFLEITAAIGDWLVKLDEAIKKGDKLGKFFDGLGTVLAAPIVVLQALGKAVFDLFKNFDGLSKLDFSGVGKAIDSIKGRLQPMSDLGKGIITVFGAIGTAFKAVYNFFKPVAEAIGSFFSNLGKQIASSLSTGDFNTVLNILNTGLFAAMALAIRKFFKQDMNIDFGGGFLSGVKESLESLTGVLNSMQQQLKAKTLLSIAGAIGILAASVAILSMIDSGRLSLSVAAMGVMFGELVGAMALLDKVVASKGAVKLPFLAAGLILLAGAMVILAGAVAILSSMDWNELSRGLVGLAGALGIVTLAANFLPKSLPLTGAGLILAATGIVILAAAMKILSTLSWDDIGRSMVALGGSLAILAIGLTLMDASLPGAASLVVASVGLMALGVALGLMAKLSWDDIGRSMVVLGGSLAILAVGLTLMDASLPGAAALVVASVGLMAIGVALQMFSKLSWDDIGRAMTVLGGSLAILAIGLTIMIAAMPGAAALVVASAALIILGGALKIMASLTWDEIGRGMVALGGSIGILALGLNLMIVALPGAAALLVASAALAILAPVLKMLGSMSWEQIGTGLGALAAALGILAAAGVLLLPAIPGLIGLGIAITLVGIGALAAGVGISALAVGLTALSVAGAAGVAAFTAILSALIAMIPQFMVSLAKGLVDFVKVLIDAAPTFVEAAVTLITTLLTAINTTAPKIIETLWNLIVALVNKIVEAVPFFIDAAGKIIIAFLNGIAAKLPGIIDAGTKLIIAFINGMQKSMNQIAEAAMDAVVRFVNGLAASIRKHTSEMREAGLNLAQAIVDGMTGGLASKVGGLIRQAQNMANSVINAAKNALGIHSPSREFYALGDYSTQGMALGLLQTADVVGKAATTVGNTAVMSLKKSMDGLSDKVATNMDFTPTITPVLDLSQVKKDAATVSSLLPSQTLSLDRSYDSAVQAIQTAQSNTQAQNQNKSEEETPTVVFNQTNNSPKALTPAEIYRQTKNQLSIVKEEINKK